MERDRKLDYIRILAMVFIVLCHFFQIVGVGELAFWLNVGVQMFLVISAKVLCEKTFPDMTSVWKFYRTRIERIIIPVWLYLLEIVLLLLIVRVPFKWSSVFVYALGGAGFAKQGMLGLGHFWYITVLLICYMLVPILSVFACVLQKKTSITRYLTLGLGCTVLILIMYLLGYPQYGVNIGLFCFSYIWFKNVGRKIWSQKGISTFGAPALVLTVIRIAISYTGIGIIEVHPLYDLVFITVVKAFQGLALVCLLYIILGYKQGQDSQLVFWLTGMSYEIYLVHQFIELAVYEYLPICSQVRIIGPIIMLIISSVLILINAWILKKMDSVLQYRKRNSR